MQYILLGASDGAISPRKLKPLPKEGPILMEGHLSMISDTGSAVQVDEEKIATNQLSPT